MYFRDIIMKSGEELELMVYNVKDIAAYIVDYSIENGCPVSNLKLQKILYYVQAYFLIKKNEPCFEEEIECWRHGPVVREVYSEYKKYFNDNIFMVEDYKEIEERDCNLINQVVDSYRKYSPWEMVDKTHQEDPWINDELSLRGIKRFFKDNEKRILG